MMLFCCKAAIFISSARFPGVEKERKMETQTTPKRLTLILVPGPFEGHMTPMLQLGYVLHSRGFSIKIAHTKFNSPDSFAHPEISFHSLSDNISDDDLVRPGVILPELLNSRCEAEFQTYLAYVMMESNDQVVAAIIYDNLISFPEVVASNLKIPSLIFRPSSASYLLSNLAIPRLDAEGYFPLQDSMLLKLVPELYPLRFKDLPLSHLTLEFTIKLLAMTSSRTTSSAIIWNTIDFLEHTSLRQVQKHYNVPIFAIGPLHQFALSRSTSFLSEDRTCIEWLDKQAPKSVIYTSIGSAAEMTEKELTETAWGLANSNQPFLWVIRPGSVRGGSEWIELLPEGFIEETAERGCIVRWAPQKEVLAHSSVGCFWSHCGWNSTLESVSEGVPMICRPGSFDQRVNARYVSYEWKVGLEMEKVLERGEIARVIRRLFVEKEGEEIRAAAAEMKKNVNACVQEGGSSYKSMNDLADFLLS